MISYSLQKGIMARIYDAFFIFMLHYTNISIEDINLELWQTVSYNEVGYAVSNFGRIKALRKINGKGQLLKPKILRQSLNMGGYLFVNLWKNKESKSFLVHVLVGQVFVENIGGKPFINHKNGVKIDNRAINLEWVTKSENALHSYRVLGNKSGMNGKVGHIRKDSKQILQKTVSGEYVNTFKSIKLAAMATSIKRENIGKCVRGERNSAGGFIWEVDKNT